MANFTKIQKEYCWPEIETIVKGKIGTEKTNEVISKAVNLSSQYADCYKDLKGFEKTHAQAAYNIAAIYIPLREVLGFDEAIKLLDETWKPAALKTNAKYNKLPPKLFIRLCRIISGSAFGNKAGFERKDLSKDKKEVRFDVTSCPYVKIMTKLGCAEACPIVCKQDEYTYGNMKGVSFIRTKTLGRGNDKCDFLYRLNDEKE